MPLSSLPRRRRGGYGINRIPEFWGWLAAMGERGLVKVPQEVYREALLLDEMVDAALVARVVAEGYADDLTDVEIEI